MRVEDTLGLACKALGARSGPDNARPLYLFLNFILEIFHLTRGILQGMEKASLQFHIEKNDFFGTLATVLDLLKPSGQFITFGIGPELPGFAAEEERQLPDGSWVVSWSPSQAGSDASL